ncbi:MAG: Asd/ArgC dimerization domain-containing protein [Phycisphaerales bacterium]|jgi:aspartate-semialdehyde dehydrogenase|nr:Asd/ArgC dimerization domain-containing protein [Phycisphaerales bacterium]
MEIAVIGARGAVGRVCVDEIVNRGHTAIALSREDDVPSGVSGVIIASPIVDRTFTVPIIDCSGKLENTSLVFPDILEPQSDRMRVPNCMASLIAQALIGLHEKCTITSIIATCMQSASGAGWKGVQSLEQNNTEDVFGGQLLNNVLPHEKAEQEESAIKKDLFDLFECSVITTSFRVPVYVGHIASLHIETKKTMDQTLMLESKHFDPISMENKRDVAIGRLRIDKNTADLVVCGDQLLCGTAIPAVGSIL